MENETKAPSEDGYLTGQLLIAMPQMSDPRFAQAVIYVCAHSAEGAMGIVVNQAMDAITFPKLLEQLQIETPAPEDQIRIMMGGPVEMGRGFVLHSADYVQDATLLVEPEVGLTATIKILRDIAQGTGPKQLLLALGYAGWGPGQLDEEIQENGWLSVAADKNLLFDEKITEKWDKALAKIGVSPTTLSGHAGHA